MQKAYEKDSSKTSRFVKVTPKLLRDMANRIDYLAKESGPGQSVTLDLTPEITLYYEIEQSYQPFVNNISASK